MLDEAEPSVDLKMFQRQALVDVGLLEITDTCLLSNQRRVSCCLHALDENPCLYKGPYFSPQLLCP